MMIPFFVVKNSTGMIVRTGLCQPEALSAQAGVGETARQGIANDTTQRWAADLGYLVSVAPPEPDPNELRARMKMTPRQLFIGMVRAGFCTAEEGIAAATAGTMPAAVEGAIAALSLENQIAARITWARMQTVERLDPLVGLLAAAVGITDAEVDAFFEGCASI